jgi:hypothetical protein
MKLAFPFVLYLFVLIGVVAPPVRGAENESKLGAETPDHRTTREAVIGGTWTWVSKDASDPTTIQFAPDGTAMRGSVKWEATSNREITITHPTQGKAVIRLSADSLSFKGTGFDGKPVSGKKTKWK